MLLGVPPLSLQPVLPPRPPQPAALCEITDAHLRMSLPGPGTQRLGGQ